MNAPGAFPIEGGCDCRAVRYRIETSPLFVHCCHCSWCQRETGSSFALNAMIESDQVTLLSGVPEVVHTPSESGAGQDIARCRHCRIALWSTYAGAGPVLKFIRVGTLDQPGALPPDIHIFTASKQAWVVIPPGAPAESAYYDRKQYWPAESLERYRQVLPLIEAHKAKRRQARDSKTHIAPTNRSMPRAVVIPELAYPDVAEAVEWLCRVFGFRERLIIGDHRAQLSFGETAAIVVTQGSSEPPHASGFSVMVRVENLQQHHAHAERNGARVIRAPADYPYGEKQYTARDFAGHAWTFTQTIADVDPALWGGRLVAPNDGEP